MTESYNFIEDERNIDTAGSEWDSGIAFAPSSNTYKLMRALLSEADRIDNELERIYEAQHINSATGEELEKFGNLINLDRKSGEGDDKYRARIKAKFRAATTGTTFDNFVEFTSSVLATDIDNLEFFTNYGADSATVRVAADQKVYDNVSLTATEVERLLGDGVPAGHEVKARVRGTFRLKNEGETSDASKGLTSDSISTGGTLAADLV